MSSSIVIRRGYRFVLVGAMSTMVHVAAAVLLIEVWALGPPLANGAAFLLATIISFIVQTQWSFGAPLRRHTFARFCAVVALGLLSSTLISALAEAMRWHYALGIAAVVAIVPAMTFVLHNSWTYPAPSRPEAQDE